MAITDAEIEFVYEIFEGISPLTHHKMMGGASFYCDGQIFAILSSEGDIFLKAKGQFAQALKAEGSRIFEMNGRSMGYWTLPDAALDDPQLAFDWGTRALQELT